MENCKIGQYSKFLVNLAHHFRFSLCFQTKMIMRFSHISVSVNNKGHYIFVLTFNAFHLIQVLKMEMKVKRLHSVSMENIVLSFGTCQCGVFMNYVS